MINESSVLGKGSLTLDLSLGLYVTETFIATTVRVNGWHLDPGLTAQIPALFPDADYIMSSLRKEDCRQLEGNGRHLAYGIDNVRRPESEAEAVKLKRRLKIYAEEK